MMIITNLAARSMVDVNGKPAKHTLNTRYLIRLAAHLTVQPYNHTSALT